MYSTQTNVIDFVDANGIWYRNRSNPIQSTQHRMDFTTRISESFQTSVSLPLVHTSIGQHQATELGEVAGSLTYQLSNGWNPSRLIPKLFVSARASRGQDSSFDLLSSKRTFETLAVNMLAMQFYGNFDGFAFIEGQQSINGFEPVGTRLNASLGIGYLWQDFRFGISAGHQQESEFAVSQPVESQSYVLPETSLNFASLQLTYTFQSQTLMTFSYIDQTLLGTPLNVGLSRGVSLQLQHSL